MRSYRAAWVSLWVSASRRLFSVSSTLPRTNSLICPLIISSLNCTILLDMVCRLLPECCVVISFYQRPAKPCLFFLFQFCATYCTLSLYEFQYLYYRGIYSFNILFIISIRIILLPSPRISTHIFKILFCLPS